VLPLPEWNVEGLRDALGTPVSPQLRTFAAWLNAGLSALNVLGGFVKAVVRCAPTKAQRSVMQMALRKAGRLLRRLVSCEMPDGAVCMTALLGDASTRTTTAVPLSAGSVDVHPRCGGVDVQRILPQELLDVVTNPKRLFTDVTPDIARIPALRGDDRMAYLKYVKLELAAGKVELTPCIQGGGSIFGVSKSGGRVRPVWNGTRVSEASLKPPKPQYLTGPAALTRLETVPCKPFFFSKRDGRSMFDQLLAPECCRPYFGQPSFKVGEYLDLVGGTLAQLQMHWRGEGRLSRSSVVFPVSRVWPMGMSWSSAICQQQTLSCCRTAGFDDSCFLADDVRPRVTPVAVAAATDDVGIFSSVSRAHSIELAQRLDRAFESANVEKNGEKDVDGSLNGTMVGIELIDGLHLGPERQRALRYLSGTLEFLNTGFCAPVQLARLLGQPHWHYQLCRPLYSILKDVYAITRLEQQDVAIPLPPGVLGELILTLATFYWLDFDLTSPWDPDVLASDASAAYGFGLSKTTLGTHGAGELGRRAADEDIFVRMAAVARGDEPEKPRCGTAVRLPVLRRDFKTLLSTRAHFAEHSGGLEAGGVHLLVRWLARNAVHHGRRHVALIDAQAVQGALRCGRSSAPTLFRHMRRLAATVVSAGLIMTYVYCPSESNPADAPSRGKVRRTMQ